VACFCLQDEKNQILIASIWLNLVSKLLTSLAIIMVDGVAWWLAAFVA